MQFETHELNDMLNTVLYGRIALHMPNIRRSTTIEDEEYNMSLNKHKSGAQSKYLSGKEETANSIVMEQLMNTLDQSAKNRIEKNTQSSDKISDFKNKYFKLTSIICYKDIHTLNKSYELKATYKVSRVDKKNFNKYKIYATCINMSEEKHARPDIQCHK